VPAGEWTYTQTTQGATQSGQHCPAIGCSWSNFDNSMSWTVNRNQAGTQLFYYVNAFHDHLRDAAGIGFNSASGNFEGADRVQAQVDDGSATDDPPFDSFPSCDYTNNAYVIPVPDGAPLFMQIFLWSNLCTPSLALNDVNAADDALIVYHEYTHGMTNRLVTDGAGFPAMNGWQPGAMDEGTADWFALDLLNAQGLEPDSAASGELRAGKYENDALRTQPYDCPVGASGAVCPGTVSVGSGGYTYGDFARILGGPEVHADGEIWVETLWDLRARLIATYGAAAGITRARALVTDGLRLAPPNPTFLDMRNAILQANANRGFGDQNRIWGVFAARGMGARATTTSANDTSPRQDFSVPGQQQQPPPPPPVDNTSPRITGLKISRKRIRVGQGITFTFQLSKASTASISIDRGSAGRKVGKRCRPPKRSLRKRPRCTRYSRVGTLVRKNLLAGTQRVRFRGRFHSRALKPGSYRATIVATDPGGKRSRAARVTFRVVRR
jgi:extracellular elastinolytic metalloproteinase